MSLVVAARLRAAGLNYRSQAAGLIPRRYCIRPYQPALVNQSCLIYGHKKTAGLTGAESAVSLVVTLEYLIQSKFKRFSTLPMELIDTIPDR